MTIKEKLKLFSNDYTEEEILFYERTSQDLLSTEPFNKKAYLSASVVIPAYNAQKTLPLVLDALSNQTCLNEGTCVEVIIIDDASTPAIQASSVDPRLNLCFVRLDINSGAGHARDVGIKHAKNDIIIFLDADIVVPNTFISNHLFAHQNLAMPSIFISFRENVMVDDLRLYSTDWNLADIHSGDHRVYMNYKKEWVMREDDKKLVGREFKLLSQTNYLKTFGNGSSIALWSLPMMFLTCAASAPAAYVKKASPTPADLLGWGFNDTCLAVKMMVEGLKIIPLLNSNVLHVLEQRHTKDDVTKNREYLLNEKVYEKLLTQEA